MDVRVFGRLDIVAGIGMLGLGLAWLLGLAPLRFFGKEIMVLFGTLKVSSAFGFGLDTAVRGLVALIGGFGFLRGRAWAWWLSALYLVEAIPANVVRAPHNVPWAAFVFTIMALKIAWLVYRFKFFRPLGGTR